MALSPIAFIAVNYRDFKNNWLKAYEPGTTTPKTMALDSEGATTVAKLQLNADGFLIASGGALVIPYIDGAYDLWLFPTEAEADANDTSNAERLADDITGALTSSSVDLLLINDISQAYEFATVDAMTSSVILSPVNKIVNISGDISAGDTGARTYIVSSTKLSDGLSESAPGGLFYNTIAGQFLAEVTLKVPTDFTSLQGAVDYAKEIKVKSGFVVDIVIDSGYAPTSGIIVENGDYRHIRISSVDALVTVATGFGQSVSFIQGNNASMPILNCLVSGNAGEMGFGYRCENNSNGYITSGNGVKDCWQDGLAVRFGSICYANATIWTGNAINATTSSGLVCWSAILYATGADVSNSGYYGAQSAHGGLLNFQNGIANDTGRYGIRGSDGAIIDADGATANDNAVYGCYAFNRCDINFRDGTALRNGTANVVSTNASNVNATGATANGSLGAGAICSGASTLDAFDADFENAATNGVEVRGSNANLGGAKVNGATLEGLLAEQSAIVNAKLLKASDCGASGISCLNGANVNAELATCDDNASYGVRSWYDGNVNLNGGTARRGGLSGIYAFSGSKIQAKGSDCRKIDGVDTGGGNADIKCLEGSFITAHSAIGGINKTTNTLNTDGVIFQ